MRNTAWLLGLVVSIGCGGGRAGTPDAGGIDAATIDAATGRDAGPPRPDSGPQPPCNPTDGIECDGDWSGHCSPACQASECCSPQAAMSRGASNFVCVPRDAEGNCPLGDIWVDAERIQGQTDVSWEYFLPSDCALMEGCVGAAGSRRLLYFDTWTPNTGGADMFLGQPTGPEASHFEYSACHGHYHFNSYAAYELRDSTGAVVASGHKQAFCLEDFYRYPGENGAGWHYDCDNQGIQRDWQDVYDSSLDCQWVDVTDVPPGDYTLHIAINTERVLAESNYNNNVVDVPVTIPADVADNDVTMSCPPDAPFGDRRNCALNRAGTYRCNAGDMVAVGCSTACGLGTCAGDTVLRVCESSHDPECTSRWALYHNDDSGCDATDYCSQTEFTCPGATGETFDFVVYTGAYDPGDAATCNLQVTGAGPT